MAIDKIQAIKRASVINYMEKRISELNKELYTRKANLLQTWYGFEMQEIPASQLYKRTHQDNTFTYNDKVFLDIDEAIDFAVNVIIEKGGIF